MILALTGVVTDGTVPAGTIPQKVPTRRDILLPRGESLTINLSVVGQNGAAYSLVADSPVIKLGLRRLANDEEATLTVPAAITAPGTGGLAVLELASDDTVDLDEFTRYRYDIHLITTTKRWQVVPVSLFEVMPIINRPDDD